MNLIENWPGIAGAATVFGMEAWALPISYDGKDATVNLNLKQKG